MFNDWKNRLTSPFQSQVIFDLPMGQKIQRGAVIVKGTIVLATTTAGTVNGEGGPSNLITRVFVRANPADTRYPGGDIVKASPRSLLRYAQMMHSGKPVLEQSGSTLGNGASGTYAIYEEFPIFWQDPTLRVHDFMTCLNTDPGSYESVQVEVDLDPTLTNCFTGYVGSSVPNVSGLQVQWTDRRCDYAADTNTVFQEDHTVKIAAQQDRMLDAAMPRDGAFLQWLIMAQLTTQNTLSDTILNKIVMRASTADFKLYAQDIRAVMYDDEWIDPSQTGAGLYYLDWSDGFFQNSLIGSTLQAEFDVNNPSGSNNDSLLTFTRRVFAPAPAPTAKK